MIMDDNDGQMIFGDLGGLKLPDICLTGEEKPRKNLTQETCHILQSNAGPLRDRRACYHLAHSGGLKSRIREVPGSNPGADQPDLLFFFFVVFLNHQGK